LIAHLLFNQDKGIVMPDSIPQSGKPNRGLIWEDLCATEEVSFLFECNQKQNFSQVYQANLSNDPFKDFVLLTVYYDDNLLSEKFIKPACAFRHGGHIKA
jgi:hypothetical protein